MSLALASRGLYGGGIGGGGSTVYIDQTLGIEVEELGMILVAMNALEEVAIAVDEIATLEIDTSEMQVVVIEMTEMQTVTVIIDN